MQTRGESARVSYGYGLRSRLPGKGEVQFGYLLYLSHENCIADAISVVARGISRALHERVVCYTLGLKNIHTTLATYAVQTISETKIDTQRDTRIVECLVESIDALVESVQGFPLQKFSAEFG